MRKAADLLLESARRGELHHAIIIHGPNPAALRELARRVAQTLNCLNGSVGDDCLSCRKIERRLHPDVHFVELAAERKNISTEQIREIVAAAALRPYEGRNKVFVIDPADAMSASGANALLKTLEEPARDTHFVLLVRGPDQLLPTIRSRSQSIYVGDERLDGETSSEDRRLRQIGTLASADRERLQEELVSLLARFAQRGESAALLAVAARTADEEATTDAIAVLALVLSSPDERLAQIDRERALAAAGALIAGIDAMRKVNADARLVIEGSLARLVTGAEV